MRDWSKWGQKVDRSQDLRTSSYCFFFFHIFLAKTCSADIQVPNGVVTGGANTFQSKRRVSCSPGYDLVGPPDLQCKANGQWSTDATRCKVKHWRNPLQRKGSLSQIASKFVGSLRERVFVANCLTVEGSVLKFCVSMWACYTKLSKVAARLICALSSRALIANTSFLHNHKHYWENQMFSKFFS